MFTHVLRLKCAVAIIYDAGRTARRESLPSVICKIFRPMVTAPGLPRSMLSQALVRRSPTHPVATSFSPYKAGGSLRSGSRMDTSGCSIAGGSGCHRRSGSSLHSARPIRTGPKRHIVLGGDVRKLGMWVSALLLTVLVSAAASAQRRVTGVVTGNAGEPVSSASVTVQGTTIGVHTAEDGRYTLNNVPAGAQVLVVRRLGYKRVLQPLPATSDQRTSSSRRTSSSSSVRSSLERPPPFPPPTRRTRSPRSAASSSTRPRRRRSRTRSRARSLAP